MVKCSSTFAAGQLHSLTTSISRALQSIRRFSKELNKPRARWTEDGIKRKIQGSEGSNTFQAAGCVVAQIHGNTTPDSHASTETMNQDCQGTPDFVPEIELRCPENRGPEPARVSRSRLLVENLYIANVI